MTEVPSDALNRVMTQIEVIKKYSSAVHESQGLIANAITQLIIFDGLNAINANLHHLHSMLTGDANVQTQDKPRIFTP